MCKLFGTSNKTLEPPTPRGIINKDDVKVIESNTIFIRNVPEEIWLTTVANTNSMLPMIDYGDLAILTNGFKHEELAIGDIVVYQANQSIIHRITDIKETEDGQRIYTCKGDNNAGNDPYQILDEHITWLLIGIIYCKKEAT